MTDHSDPTALSDTTINGTPRTLMGFDFGTIRIGIAIGQEITASARPLVTLNSKTGKPDWTAISNLIDEWHPDILVVGVPLSMDSSEHDMTLAARKFCRQLEGRFGIPVNQIDERLSSVEAEFEIRESGRSSRKDKGAVDRMAAALILETWFHEHPYA